MQGFKKFLMRGNLIDLAIAVVVGAAFSALVNSLVKDLITPLIAAIGGNPDFSDLTFTINKSQFRYGDFFNALIAFLIVATVIYFLVLAPFTRLLGLFERKKEATERDCPECLSEIPVGAGRCKFCTAEVPPLAGSVTLTD